MGTDVPSYVHIHSCIYRIHTVQWVGKHSLAKDSAKFIQNWGISCRAMSYKFLIVIYPTYRLTCNLTLPGTIS